MSAKWSLIKENFHTVLVLFIYIIICFIDLKPELVTLNPIGGLEAVVQSFLAIVNIFQYIAISVLAISLILVFIPKTIIPRLILDICFILIQLTIIILLIFMIVYGYSINRILVIALTFVFLLDRIFEIINNLQTYHIIKGKNATQEMI